MSECREENGVLYFRNRKWAPNSETLRTKLIQDVHDSPIAGHPGRETTYETISREYYWPSMSNDIRRFVRNCDVYRRTKAWREQKKGLLKPLPVPDRPWQEVSMDFITDSPKSEGRTNILVITDRLTKGVIFEPMADIEAETTARTVINSLIRRHGPPRTITSDRGT